MAGQLSRFRMRMSGFCLGLLLVYNFLRGLFNIYFYDAIELEWKCIIGNKRRKGGLLNKQGGLFSKSQERVQ